MRVRRIMLVSLAVAIIAGGRLVIGEHHARAVSDAALTRAGLPSLQSAKTLLSAALTTTRHPQWVDIPSGSAPVRSFVVFPERHDTSAPVVVITADDQGISDWLRAVGDDAAANGFIAIVPERRTDAVDRYAVGMPGSNGKAAAVRFSFGAGTGRIDTTLASTPGGDVAYELTDHAWHRAIAALSAALDAPGRSTPDARAGQGQAGGGAAAAPAAPGGMTSKRADLPANFLMAAKTVAQSPRKGEWVDIPMRSGTKLHTWISYPQNVTRAPVVLIFQPGPGMDMGEPPVKGGGANWLRAIADQLASEGFIGVLPDLTSGLGPNGGNYDSFQFPDDSARAISRISHAEVLDRIRVGRDYALKLPMANGKLGATGFCMGGGLAWEAPAEIEGVNASVVFYGNPPAEAIMARIKAPVAAFFGANDLGLAPRVAPATADMKRLGKDFTVQVYPEATHVFLYRQDLGKNMTATEDAWPRAMAFLKRHLVPSASF
ncbi:MAG TPA: dienelactone hydrolase family protein [Vicinamibacterales bacterium]|jgi:carboxymethylenebutenolidase